ncbi:HSP20-like chaperone [Aspergillus egyptiacus]|nr:HSP20-like chaperone [Aspergillus egyptiacus]
MAFFPRHCSGDFAPLFQLLDDYDMHQSTRRSNNKAAAARTFSPKFDIYELNNRYYLDGELPGVNQSNVEIEFTDPQTLIIRGRSERNYGHHKQQPDADDKSETSSVRSLQPTVEEWDEMTDADPVTERTPASAPKEKAVGKKSSEPAYKFWVSERSIGAFHRAFTFPTRIDQDSVKASLNNGILSLTLPKEPAPQLKKIRVE